MKNFSICLVFIFAGYFASQQIHAFQKLEVCSISKPNSEVLENYSIEKFNSLETKDFLHHHADRNSSNSSLENSLENFNESESEVEFDLLAWELNQNSNQLLNFISNRKIDFQNFSTESKNNHTALFILFHSWKFFLS